MAHRTAGISLIAFGTTLMVVSVVTALLLDALMVDLIAVIVVFLGSRVVVGSRVASGWSIAIMAYYLLAAVLAFALPDHLRIGTRPIRPTELPWALIVLASSAVWSIINIGLLTQALRSPGEASYKHS